MSSLPKEQQTAYQRWEMASFGEDQPNSRTNGRRATDANAASQAKLAQEVAAAREQARAEGYAAGLAQGRSAGLEKGREEGLEQGRTQAAQERIHLQQIAEAFGVEVAHANEAIAHDILELALDFAKAMLKNTFEVRPQSVLPIVSEAVRYLPTLQQPALLYLHPADAELVRQQMEDELVKSGWRIAEDAHMERGGCRVETASNQIDATTSTRWQRLSAALGKESDWLA